LLNLCKKNHPRAIRDFLAYTYHHWAGPALRFVLLVGDASWDTKNTTIDDANYANWTNRQLLNGPRFSVKQSTTYQHAIDPSGRNLIPTWNYASAHGHAASDTWFVTAAGCILCWSQSEHTTFVHNHDL
jgi:hypothetical protein